MEDENEVLDWGNEDDEQHQESYKRGLDRRGSGDGEDVEDSVSLGDDEEQDFYPYRGPSGGSGAAANGESNSNAIPSPPHIEDASRQHRRDSSAHSQKPSSVVGTPPKQRQQQSPGLQRSQPRITHALPPKPVVANVPFLHPSHPSIVEATAMSRSAARNDTGKKNNNPTSARRSLSADQDASPLPPHWEARQPRSGGREVYFYNTLTHESTWSRPVSSNSNLPSNPPRSAQRRDSSVSLGARPQSPPRPDSQSLRSTRPPPQLDTEFTDAQSSAPQAIIPSVASSALSYEDRHYRPAGAEAAPPVDARPRRNPDTVDLPSHSQVHQAQYAQAALHPRARSLSPSSLSQSGGPPQRGGRPYAARGHHNSTRGARNTGTNVEHHAQWRHDPSPAADFPARHRNLSPAPYSDTIGSHTSRTQHKPRRHPESDADVSFDPLGFEGRDRHGPRNDHIRGRTRDRDQDLPSREMLMQQSQNQLSASRHRSPSPRPRPERKAESLHPDEHNDHQLPPPGAADLSAKNGRPIERQEAAQSMPPTAPPVTVSSVPPSSSQAPRPRNRPSRFDRPTPLPPKPKSPPSEAISVEGPSREHEFRPDVDAPVSHQRRAGDRDLDAEHTKLIRPSVSKQIDPSPGAPASYGSYTDHPSTATNPDKVDSPLETSGQVARPKRIPLPPQETSFREIHPTWVGPPRPVTGDLSHHDAPAVPRPTPDQTAPPPHHLHRYEDRNGSLPGPRFPPQLRNGRIVSETHPARFGRDSRAVEPPDELMDTNSDGFPAMSSTEREPLGGMYADREPSGSASDVVPRAPRSMGREGPPVVSTMPIPPRGASFRDRSRDGSPPPHAIGSARRGYDNRMDAPGWDGANRNEYHANADNRAYRNREPRSHPHEFPPRPPQNSLMPNMSGTNNPMTGDRRGPTPVNNPEPNFPIPGGQRHGAAPPPFRPNHTNVDMRSRGRERETPPNESFDRNPAIYTRNVGNQGDRYRPGPPPEFEAHQHRFNNAPVPPFHQRPHQRGLDDVDRLRRDGPYPFDEKPRAEDSIPSRAVRNHQGHPRPQVPSPPHDVPALRPKPALNTDSDYRAATPPPISRDPSVSSQHWEELFSSDPGLRSAHPHRHVDETRSTGHDGSDGSIKRRPLVEHSDAVPPPQRARFDRPMPNDGDYPHNGRLQERLGGRRMEQRMEHQQQHQHHQQRYPPGPGPVRQQHPLPANPSLHADRDNDLPNNERYRGGPPVDGIRHSWTENNNERERQRGGEPWAGHNQPPSHPPQHHPGHPHVYERETAYQPSRDMREPYDRHVMDQDSRPKPIRIRRPPPPSPAFPPGSEDASRPHFERRSFDSHPRNREFGPDRDRDDTDFPDRFNRTPAPRRGGSLLDRLSIGHGPADQGDPAPMHVDSPSLRERVQVPSKRDHEQMDVDDVGEDGYGLDGDGDDGMDPATKRARKKNLKVKKGGKRV